MRRNNRIFRIARALSIALALTAIGLSSSSADVTIVSGDVSGVWTADSVLVADSIYVSPGNTLTIEPGVRVLFLSAYFFTVNDGAVLHAVGTETDSIYFLSAVSGYSTLGIDFFNASNESILGYCYFSNALYSAVALTNSDITIRNCLFEDNSGYYRGGAISALEGSDALIENNIIRNNLTVQQGGGIYCDASSPTIRDNLIDGNISGPIATGGGISCNNHSHPLIINNTIRNNQVYPSPIYPSTQGKGAAIYVSNLSNPVITGNLFLNNRVNSGGAVGQSGGGAIFVFSAAPIIENNVFAGNVVEYGDGGALLLFIYNGSLVNNVFSGNTAAGRGGAIYMDLSNPSVTNSIIYGNSAPNGPAFYLDRNSEVTVTYSDIEGGWEGVGNIDTDPFFRNPGSGDCRLQAIECGYPYDSPCIDDGSPDYADSLLDCSWGLGTALADMGAYGGGEMASTGIEDIVQNPTEYFVVSSYPNPFNAQTTISYNLPQASHVSLRIYDSLGRKVEILIDNDYISAGQHQVTWHAADYSSGMYFYSLRTENYETTNKMALLK